MTTPTRFHLAPFFIRSPSPEPPPDPSTPPEMSDSENSDVQISESPSRIPPPIVNRNVARLSQPIPFDVYGLFLKIQDKFNEDQDASTAEIADQIFWEGEDEFKYLHQTPLKKYKDLFSGFCVNDTIDEYLEEKLLSTLSEIFTISIFNSSLGKMATDFDRSITQYLPQITFRRFQTVIERGKKVLEKPMRSERNEEMIRKLRSVTIEVDQLFNLYSYIEGEEGLLYAHLFYKAYAAPLTPQFPDAKKFYCQFKISLEQRKKDSPLFDLKQQLHTCGAQILQLNHPNSQRIQSTRTVFYTVEAEAIWNAGMKILQTAYTTSFSFKEPLSPELIYQEWSLYSQESFLDCAEIIKKFIKTLSEDDFNFLLARVRCHHTNEDSKNSEGVRADIIFHKFRFNFRYPSQHLFMQPAYQLTFENLKTWCAT